MLVIAHQQDKIGDVGVRLIGPAVVVERDCEHDGVISVGKSFAQFLEEEFQIRLSRRRDTLEVNGQP
jgi:hypothetical protein